METPQPAPRPPRPSPEPSREPCWTCLCTKASQTFPRATFSGTSLNLTRRLHQCTPELFLAEDPVNLRCSWGISFGGIPNSRSVLFLQIFLKRAAKPSAGNPVVPIELDLALHQRFPKPSPGPSPKPSPEPVEPDLDLHETPVEPLPGFLWNLLWNLVEPDLTLHQSRNLLRNPVDSDPALHQSLLDLLRNLPRNPVEPDLALHQSLPEPCFGTLLKLCFKASQAFSGTCSGTLLKPTWLCTKASQTFTRTFSGTLLNLTWLCTKAWPSTENFPEPCWTWPGSATKKASRTLSGTFSGTLLNSTWLCTKASRNLLRNLRRNLVEPDLALHQSLPKLSLEPSPEPRWTWPGACTSAHRSYSGLKTPLAYAVGEKCHNQPESHGRNAHEGVYSSHPYTALKAFSTFSS